nr:MAG TPA: hypothetical protein [Caudoviricetes sp.]
MCLQVLIPEIGSKVEYKKLYSKFVYYGRYSLKAILTPDRISYGIFA